jgi:hypothetical protein
MLEAKSATNAILGTNSDSAASSSRNFMRDGITAILERLDDSQAVIRISQLLQETFNCKNFERMQIDFGEPLTQQNIIRFAYFAISQLSDAEAEAVLASQASCFNFQYSHNSDVRSQLQAFLDSRINAFLVTDTIHGLKQAIWDREITEKACLDISDELTINSSSAIVNPIFISAAEKKLRELHQAHPNDPIICLSIGCGRGNNELALYHEIKKRMPDLNLIIVGFDPHQTIPNNPITKDIGGRLINRELESGETYIDAVKKELGTANPIVLAVERYSLHHMNRTVDKLLEDVEGAPLISVDHPIDKEQRESLSQRAAMIAYDLLSAQVRTARYGGTWIPEAMANPNVFSILYRREEDIKSQTEMGVEYAPVAGKKPPTWIISYPANIELSRKNEIAKNGTHVAAALNPPGGRWTARPYNP